jgi:hypothetical protein
MNLFKDAILRAIVAVVFIATIDAILNGALLAVMRNTSCGFNQHINDVYQITFGLAVAAMLVYLWKRDGGVAARVLVMIFTYGEDALYFLILPLVQPVIRFITDGSGYVVPGLIPDFIGGWIGAIARLVFDKSFVMRHELALIGALLGFVVVLINPSGIFERRRLR